MLSEKIGVIGAGKIGSALLRGIIQTNLVDKSRIMASVPDKGKCRDLEQQIQIKVSADNGEVCDFADVVILCVKPLVVPTVLSEIKSRLGVHKLLVSVAAGISTGKIETVLEPGARVVRVMTNTPCVIGAAASAYARGAHATEKDLEHAERIFSSVGTTFLLDERHLDSVTGLAGSGPAYVFLFIESLADGGVQMGLGGDVARRLALQTVYGAAKMALESGKHLAKLKDEVTSPGGTTIAGLYALEKGGFRATVMDAVAQATRRSQELGKLT